MSNSNGGAGTPAPDSNPAKGVITLSLPIKPTRGDGAEKINVIRGQKK